VPAILKMSRKLVEEQGVLKKEIRRGGDEKFTRISGFQIKKQSNMAQKVPSKECEKKGGTHRVRRVHR